MLNLQAYGSDSSESEDEKRSREDLLAHLKPIDKTHASSSALTVAAAPVVMHKEEIGGASYIIDPLKKDVTYNPKYEQLHGPVAGPAHPFKTRQFAAQRNMLSGFAEPAHIDKFQFDNQRQTFHSYGYAADPSFGAASGETETIVRAEQHADTSKTVFEKTKLRPGDKRKRELNDKPDDIEGFLGPWGKFEDEETVSKPSEEEQKDLDIYLTKKNKKTGKTEEKPADESSTLHIKDAHDYQGRSFLHAPRDVGVNLQSTEPPERCFIPKALIHTWTGHTKGISAIRWYPKTAHLMLSAAMDSKIKIWEVYNDRRCVRTYLGHKQAVRDVQFNNGGDHFLSASYDRYIKLWDTETGQCVSRFTTKKVPYCVKFNPDEDKQHLFVAGMSDKKIVCFDTRTGEVEQEYDRHLGAVNTITFFDDNRRMATTSDDKSIRLWEWNVPVDFKYIADPSMHSMPATTVAPNGKWMAAQSMDNEIVIFNILNRFKFARKKKFKGHMVAGYACNIDFSPDMSYLISGDADGRCFVWDWRTTKLYHKWKAHDDVCISVLWHPHETSKVATAGWDGTIKYWD